MAVGKYAEEDFQHWIHYLSIDYGAMEQFSQVPMIASSISFIIL